MATVLQFAVVVANAPVVVGVHVKVVWSAVPPETLTSMAPGVNDTTPAAEAVHGPTLAAAAGSRTASGSFSTSARGP